jgi:hypothetical protein
LAFSPTSFRTNKAFDVVRSFEKLRDRLDSELKLKRAWLVMRENLRKNRRFNFDRRRSCGKQPESCSKNSSFLLMARMRSSGMSLSRRCGADKLKPQPYFAGGKYLL